MVKLSVHNRENLVQKSNMVEFCVHIKLYQTPPAIIQAKIKDFL